MAKYLDNRDPSNIPNRHLKLERAIEKLKREMLEVESLADISPNLGDVRTFRLLAFTTGKEPTDADTCGVAILAIPETFPEGDFNIAGINIGELQFGMSAVDGSGIFGAGKVKLNRLGMLLESMPDVWVPDAGNPDPSAINWIHPTSGLTSGRLYTDYSEDLHFMKSDDVVHTVAMLEDIPDTQDFGIPFGLRNWIHVQAMVAAYTQFGVAAPTSSGTLTALAGDTSRFVNHAIAATAATVGGLVSANFTVTRSAYHPNFRVRIRTGSVITNLRIWVLLCGANPGNVDDLSSPGDVIGFRFSTVAGDTNWRAVAASAVSGMGINTVQSDLPLVEASHDYLMEVFYDSGSYRYRINGVECPAAHKPAYVPTSTKDLGFAVKAITTTGTAKNFAISNISIEFGL